MRTFLFFLASALFVAVSANASSTVTLFHETFNGYLPSNGGAGFPYGGDPINPGLAEIAEGADELWYGARFEAFDNGTIPQDLAVQKIPGGGRPSPDPVGRAEDDAGMLFRLDTTGLADVQLKFDWRMFNGGKRDQIVVSYSTLDLAPFFGGNRLADFYNHPDAGNGKQSGSTNPWVENNFTELLRDKSARWRTEDFALPSGEPNLWIAFWIDNGEGDFIKFDNIKVTAKQPVVPETASMVAWGGLLLVGGCYRRRG